MSEFGHTAIRIPDGVIDCWGWGPFVIVADKSYRFEDSARFGPALINRRGDPIANQPSSNSQFWRAHFLWRRQGRQVEPDGVTCIWREPKPTLYRIVRRQVITVEQGEPDGQEINVTELPLAMLPAPKVQP